MQASNLTRRAAIAAGAAAAGLAAAPALAAEKPVSRIAFGSCAKQDKDQPIWEAVLDARPDLFIFLGDNVYLDTRDPSVMAEKYALLAAKPGFQALRATTPILAIWDDHDYGENDAGADYPMKAESRRQFCDFWGESAASPRRTRADGIYAEVTLGPKGRRVQVILPDLRWNRTPIAAHDLNGGRYEDWEKAMAAAGREVPGPYARNPAPKATMLGQTQWAWLDSMLAKPAQARILASSLQVVADFPGWEAWINYAEDHQLLLETIRRRRAGGLVCISGDTHYGEVSRLDRNAPYPLWDFTSSGLTEVWPVTPPNALRVGEVWRDRNFGLLDFDWTKGRIRARICDEAGAARLEQTVELADLAVRA